MLLSPSEDLHLNFILKNFSDFVIPVRIFAVDWGSNA